MRKIYLLFSFTLLMLVGCSNDSLHFKGESTNWIGTYKSTIDGDKEDGAYIIKYKRENPEKIKVLNIVINGGEIDFNGDGKALDQHKEISLPNRCTDCLTTRNDKKMKIDIKWDAKEETITLKK
ncbi:hypothetical protein [Bacillus sp. AFS041924]|uniref:hypothetical protein n=1 Tax=Bacillus sp. AFS041924 TaxID=2033503 RepID=UPI000BFB9099|nr:hypothetical protein [Bacillus sp. AFS041924]PGS46523.1 hypothetical protein COC46_20960 [Bacillus sp. AFS041924]